MHPLIGLPKTAQIQCNGLPLISIENHRVVSKDGIMYWMMFMNYDKQWKHILSQFISQGFKIGGVIEECIRDMKDQKHVNRILFDFYSTGIKYEDIVEKSQSPEIRKIVGRIIKKLKTCKNWNQLYQMMRKNSNFQKQIQKQMEGGKQ